MKIVRGEGAIGTGEANSVLDLLGKVLESEKDATRRDGEVIYRALVALGNMVSGWPIDKEMIET